MINLWPIYSDACIQDCEKLLRAGRSFFSVQDDEIGAIEKAFLGRFSCHDHAIFANSATSIAYSIYAYLLKQATGKKCPNVIVPANTYRASVLPLLPLGITPRFYDQERIGEVDCSLIDNLINEDTLAILVTHLFGIVIDMEGVYALSKKRAIPVIEDCSHTHGTAVGHWKPGDGAFAAFYSTGTKKIISGGMGGMLCTSSQDLYDYALEITQPPAWAAKKSIQSHIPYYGSGFNMRGNPLSARLARDHVERIDSIIRNKNDCLTIVKAAIKNSPLVDLLEPVLPQSGTLYNLPFSIKSDREWVFRYLKKNKLRVKVYKECLPNHTPFNPLTLKQIRYKNHNLYYFDTRDLYESRTVASAYAKVIFSLSEMTGGRSLPHHTTNESCTQANNGNIIAPLGFNSR